MSSFPDVFALQYVHCGKLFSVLLPVLTLYNFIRMLIHCDLCQNWGLQLPALLYFALLTVVQLQERQ